VQAVQIGSTPKQSRLLLEAQESGADGADAPDRPGQVQLVVTGYRPPPHEIGAKTLEFSAASLAERWDAGHCDMSAALTARAACRAEVADLGFALYRGKRTHNGRPSVGST